MNLLELDQLAERAKSGEPVNLTGRTLLGMFGASRRGSNIVALIREELKKRGVVTDPDFNEVWVDVDIALRASTGDGQEPDPVERISRLPSANREVVSVAPGTKIAKATTIMTLRDYSQLPVIRGDRDCKGAVTWEAIAVAAALGHPCETVDDVLVPVETVAARDALLESIPKILKYGFALVVAADKRFQGIVTAADLSQHSRDLSEPFLLIGQIERYLRKLIEGKFSLTEIQAARNPKDTARTVNRVSDLSFGEYVRLIEPETSWPKLQVAFERESFLDHLRKVQNTRNDVMHFDPEPLGREEIDLLRDLACFLVKAVR